MRVSIRDGSTASSASRPSQRSTPTSIAAAEPRGAKQMYRGLQGRRLRAPKMCVNWSSCSEYDRLPLRGSQRETSRAVVALKISVLPAFTEYIRVGGWGKIAIAGLED